jgi:signal transduction histidine kinase
MSSAPDVCEDAPSAVREVGLGLVALVVAALVGSGWYLGFHLGNAHNGLIAASFTVVGLYIVRMRPRHRQGWLFVCIGMLHAVMFFGRQYGLHSPLLAAAPWIGWIGVWPLPLVIAVFGWSFMTFPDGRLPSPRWRIPLIAMLIIAAVLSGMSALWPADYDRTGLLAAHPLKIPGSEQVAQIWDLAQISLLLFQVLWTAAIVVRMRRAHGDTVRQMRWLVYAVVIDVVLLAGGLVVAGSPMPGLVALPLIPAAAGVAIVKYRLYDIDPVINKTIVIGAMLLVITAGYVAIVVGLGSLLPAGERWLSIFTTAVVAVVFEPLRRRAQRLADRLVYGHRTTPYEALSRLSTQLESAPEALLDVIAATVANAVGAREVIVLVGTAESLFPQAGWPRLAGVTGPKPLPALDLGPLWHVRPVAHHGVVRGAITVRKPAGESLTAAEDRLLADLVAQTGLILLQKQQAEEIQAAARRIVTAQDTARHRIERDLHDGAQHRLVTLGLELGTLAEQAKATGDAALTTRVNEARTQLLEATAELRELAHGLHPMVLAQSGLQAALEMLADRSAIPVRLNMIIHKRLPHEIEATAYYLVSEALTNAARHSGADLATVSVAQVHKGLSVEVTDNGHGGAQLAAGSGLQGISDRLAALGAQLHLDSPSKGGTRIKALLPCG